MGDCLVIDHPMTRARVTQECTLPSDPPNCPFAQSTQFLTGCLTQTGDHSYCVSTQPTALVGRAAWLYRGSGAGRTRGLARAPFCWKMYTRPLVLYSPAGQGIRNIRWGRSGGWSLPGNKCKEEILNKCRDINAGPRKDRHVDPPTWWSGLEAGQGELWKVEEEPPGLPGPENWNRRGQGLSLHFRL